MMKLRSGNLRKEDCNVDLGHREGNLKRAKIPDLNLTDETDVVSSEKEEGECCEVSQNEVKSNGVGGEECNGMDVQKEENTKGLEKDFGLSGDGKESGVEKSNVDPSLVSDEEKIDGLDVDTGIKGVATSGIDPTRDKLGFSEDFFAVTRGNSKRNWDRKIGLEDCDIDLNLSLKTSSSIVKCSKEKISVVEDRRSKFDEGDKSGRLRSEAKEGRSQVLGKVLRSRIVPAKGLGEEAGVWQIKAPASNRKKESYQSNEKVAVLDNLLHESKTDNTNDISLRSSGSKRKREKHIKSIDHPKDLEVHVHQRRVVSQVEYEVMAGTSTLNTTKDRLGGKKLIDCSKEDDGVSCSGEGEAGKVSKKLAGSSTQIRKSERSKGTVDYSENEVNRKKLPVSKIEYESEDEDKGEWNMKDASSKTISKLGRPKNSIGNGPVKREPFDNATTFNRKEEDGETSSKGTSSYKKMTSGGCDLHEVDTSSRGEETLKNENSKRGEVAGSLTAEKNSIRNQIVDMLRQAGWTIEYRPRNGRDYNDTVYINSKGNTFWSITKAYFSLQQEFEKSKARSETARCNFSFTPLPEEALSKLFRVVSKTRSDKNKKKKNKDVDGSDEDAIKKKHSGLKRKSSTRDGTHNKRRWALVARRSKGLNPQSHEAIAYSGKNSVLAWLIGSGLASLDGKVQYINATKTGTMFEGRITKDGIYCLCCKKIYSVLEFEKHSGSELGHPYGNLHLESGQSLLQCQLECWNKQDATNRKGFHSVKVDGGDPSDDTCASCGDGGDLMCCDSCPSTFHHDCLNIEAVPSDEWHCVYCICKFCRGVGRQEINDCDTSLSSLATCCLCEGKYHLSCADEEDFVDIKSGKATFCSKICGQIFKQLQTLIGTKTEMGDGFSWTLLQRFDVKADVDSFEAQKIENNSKLAVALSVLEECFVPIIDPRSRINLIQHVVYNSGSNLTWINFNKFFTIVLEKGDEVISAASIRIHGKQLAEMPFIGTRNIYRRQGMCRRLLTAVEMALGSLNIENLVIPAVPELVDTWTSVFGFRPLEETIRNDMRSMNMLVFAHTILLQKPLSEPKLLNKGISTIGNNANDVKSGDDQFDGSGPEKSEVDDSCSNASFDLNVVAPGIPGSLSDERPISRNNVKDGLKVQSEIDVGGSDNADIAEVKSGIVGGSDISDIAEGDPTLMEISDKKVVNMGVSQNYSEACVTTGNQAPSCEEKGSVNPCSESSCNMSCDGGESGTTAVPKVGSI